MTPEARIKELMTRRDTLMSERRQLLKIVRTIAIQKGLLKEEDNAPLKEILKLSKDLTNESDNDKQYAQEIIQMIQEKEKKENQKLSRLETEHKAQNKFLNDILIALNIDGLNDVETMIKRKPLVLRTIKEKFALSDDTAKIKEENIDMRIVRAFDQI